MQYPGGKGNAGTYQKLINLIPPHDVYIESFLGGGAIMRWKRPARLNIGVEKSMRVLRLTAGTITDGDRSHGAPASPELAGRSRVHTPTSGDADGRRFLFVCADALDFLAGYPFTGGEFVYCDPPYPLGTRSSGRTLYDYELTDADHVRLLALLCRLPCAVAVSSYRSALYDSTLAHWNYTEFSVVTRGGRMATESVWYNYPAPEALHDYRFLGEDYRERERIKRKKTRWVNRLKRMSALERRAMLWAIQDYEAGESCPSAPPDLAVTPAVSSEVAVLDHIARTGGGIPVRTVANGDVDDR